MDFWERNALERTMQILRNTLYSVMQCKFLKEYTILGHIMRSLMKCIVFDHTVRILKGCTAFGYTVRIFKNKEKGFKIFLVLCVLV